MKTKILGAIVLLCYIKTNSQIILEHLTKKEGLPSNNVNCISQDKEGYIWIGTDNGIVRYDGKMLKTYTVDDGLTSNEITGFYTDPKGRVWIFCFGGDVCFYKNGKIYNKANYPKLRKIPRYFFNYFQLHKSTDSSLNIFYNHMNSKIHKHVELELNLKTLDFKEIFTQFKGIDEYDYSLSGYIADYNNNRNKKIDKKQFAPKDLSQICLSFPVGKNKSIIQLENYKLFQLDNNLKIKNTFQPREVINNQIELKNGTIFFQTRDILYKLSDEKINLIRLPMKITSFFFDQLGNLWVASPSGVYHILSKSLDSTFLCNVEKRPVYSLYNFKGMIYAGLDENSVLNLKTNHLVNFPKNQLGASRVLDFFQLNGGIYTLGDNGSYHVLQGHALPKRLNGACKNATQTNDNEILYSNFRSLVHLKRDHGKILENEAYLGRVFNAYQTKNKTVWIGTETGLKYSDSSMTKFLNLKLPFENMQMVKHIQEDIHGTMIFSTNNGVALMRNGRFYHISKLSGLLDNSINKTYPSRCGNYLYICTNLGFNKLRYRFEASKLYFSLNSYTTSDGLPSEVTYTALEDDGKVYVGTNEGIAIISVNDTTGAFKIPIKLESIQVNDSLVNELKTNWRHNQNSFQFCFSAFYFQRKKEMKFAYQLLPIDKNKVISENSSIIYRGLAPGDYTIKVQAFDRHYPRTIRSDVWTYSFTISPPYYKTWWFYSLVTFSLVSVGFVLYIMYLRRKQRRDLNVQTLLKKMAQHRLEALKGQMNPHFIFNSLNTVQHLIALHDVRKAMDFIAKFSALVRKMLEFARVDRIALDKEIQFLKDYVEIEQIRYNHKFDVEFKINLEDADDIQLPTMLIQPLLENAIKHGVSNLNERRGLIVIEVEESEKNWLKIRVQDNGLGDTKKESASKDYKSAALEIVRERLTVYEIEERRGHLSIQFSENGTVAELVLPI